MASIFFRPTAWSMGARRRSAAKPAMFVPLGDSFRAIAVHIPSHNRLSIRSWMPSSANEWRAAKNYSYFDDSDTGLTRDLRGHLPKLGAPKLLHELFPLGNAEFLIDFPTFMPSPAEIRFYANRDGSPPPPPEQEEAEPRTALALYAGTATPLKTQA